jgi:hypothetical protein
LRLLSLEELETPQLRQARAGRSWGEYCWTLTPFLPPWVLERDPEAEVVTYIDADCWLAGPVAPLLARFEASGAACMITPHAYSRGRDRTASAGTYCVQFMPFRRGSDAQAILAWWQARCLERCDVHRLGGIELAGIDRALQRTDVHFAPLGAVRLVEAALRQAPVQRHLATLVAADGDARTGESPLQKQAH